MEKIWLSEARELLKAAMETKGPDFVYNSSGIGTCSYKPIIELGAIDDPRRTTGCLIGVAMKLHGGLESLLTYKGNIAELNKDHNILTEDACEYWGIAQMIQDTGGTWGYAYNAAENWLRNTHNGN